MKLFDTIKRVLGGRQKGYTVAGHPELIFERMGIRIGDERVQEPYAQNTWAHTAVKAKAELIASVPVKVWTGKRGTLERTEVPDGGEWGRLIERPSPLYPSWEDFILAVSTFMDLYGEAPLYALGYDGEWARGTVPAELILLSPAVVSERLDSFSQLIDHWEIADSSRMRRVPEHQVRCFKEFNPHRPFRGFSPMAPIALALDFDLAIHQFNSALLRNGGDPGGIAKIPNARQWTEAQRNAFLAQWEDRHRGARKAGRPAVMDKDADYIPIAVNSKQMQWLEALEWARGEIKAALRVTDLELGMFTDQTFANAGEARRWLWENSLIPRMRRFEGLLWAWLFKPRSMATGQNVWLEFDVSGVPALRHAFASRLSAVATLAPHYGINQINERLDLGMPEVPWGDEPAGGAMPLDEEPEAAPVFPAKTLTKGWQESAERIMVRAARDYFRDLRDRAIARVRSAKADDDQAYIDRALGTADDWQDVAQATFPKSIGKVIDRMKAQLKREGFTVIPPDEELLRIAKARMGELIKVSKRDRVKLGRILRQGLEEDGGFGSVDAVAERIDGHFKTQNSARAMTIARTETGMVGSQVRHETFKANGVERIMWSAASDEHTRESHSRVDGETVEVGQRFSNGLRHPSEPGAPAAEVINCRCVAVPA